MEYTARDIVLEICSYDETAKVIAIQRPVASVNIGNQLLQDWGNLHIAA